MKKAKLIIALVVIAAVGLAVGIYATSSADSNVDEVDTINTSDTIIGNTPISCGYSWDAERQGWHRPWDPDSFIPAIEMPEWQEFVPGDTIVEMDGSDEFIIGGSPASCGYSWDAERNGWHRPWDSESFIPATEKPEWAQYVPVVE